MPSSASAVHVGADGEPEQRQHTCGQHSIEEAPAAGQHPGYLNLRCCVAVKVFGMRHLHTEPPVMCPMEVRKR
jgi:hypothetical protein